MAMSWLGFPRCTPLYEQEPTARLKSCVDKPSRSRNSGTARWSGSIRRRASPLRRRLHPAARLARALRLVRDLALEFRIDPDPRDAPRRLDLRVRRTRGAIHRDIVSHIRRLDRPAKHSLADPTLGRPQPRRAGRPGRRRHHDREAAALRTVRRLAFESTPVAPPPRSLATLWNMRWDGCRERRAWSVRSYLIASPTRHGRLRPVAMGTRTPSRS